MYIYSWVRIIKTIQVVNTYPKKLLGTPPCTLTDYFNKEIIKSSEAKMGEPAKKPKYENGFDVMIIRDT
jgi:hypothetical protein